jgi:hypothetical protein
MFARITRNEGATMFSRIVVAGLCVSLLLGCGKKTVKFTGSSENTTPAQTANNDKSKSGEKNDKNKKGGEKPNLLNDPRYQPEKNELGTDAGGLPGKPGWGINSKPEGGWASQNPQPGTGKPPTATGAAPGATLLPVGGSPPGIAGPGVVPPNAAPPIPPAASNATGNKAVAKADMDEVWVFIENRSGASGKMPSVQDIQAALVEQKSPAAELVRYGSIVLTGSGTRESVWAYERNALTNGGWVVSQNGVETVTATELKNRLGR